MPVWLRGVFIIAVHHAFVLGLGARHGGIVKLSVVRCVTVFACFTYLLLTYCFTDEVIRWGGGKNRPASRGTETSK